MHRNFRHSNWKLGLVVAVVLVALAGGVAGAVAGQLPGPAAPNHLHSSPLVVTGSGFTYQGRLIDGGNPANGQYDLVFTLYDAATGGNLVGNPVTQLNQAVSAGLFTVVLDYGPAAFVGQARWLEIAVRPAGSGSYTTLAPRQPLTPSPYALSAPWFGTSGKPTGYNPQRLANTFNVPVTSGANNSLAVTIGTDGLPLIAYSASGNLNTAHCADGACSSAGVAVVNTGSADGISLTSGGDGLGLISFRTTSSNLGIAHCANVACSATDAVGFFDLGNATAGETSATIGADGLPLISYAYHSGTVNVLKVLHCTDALCLGGAISTIDLNNANYTLGRYAAVAIGADGLPLISYESGVSGAVGLKLAHCGNAACSAGNVLRTLDSNIGVKYTSLAIGADGLALIAYYDATNGQMKIAHCDNATCSTNSVAAVAFTTGGGDSALVIGPDGLGLIAYNNGVLAISAHCANVACSLSYPVVLDGAGTSGVGMSGAVGIDGLPLLVYQDASNFSLRAAHCGSPQCISYQRRR